jgi:uncharacterized phage protein (TIGR02218 family)
MKTTTAQGRGHLAGELTTLATCWKLTRRDGVPMGFTDHDRDLRIGGQLYSASSGYTRSAIASQAGLAVDNVDLDGVLDHDTITDRDIRAGLYDRAEILVFLVDWTAPNAWQIIMRRGWIGEPVITPDGSFKAELRGLAQAMSQNVLEIYQPECRADLGDRRCKVDLAALTATGTVAEVIDRRTVVLSIADARGVNGYYAGGAVTFQSGLNAGRAIEVRSWVRTASPLGRAVLFLPPPYTPAVGDAVSIFPGCDGRRDTCVGTFANILNFRGEPDLPGRDKVIGGQ